MGTRFGCSCRSLHGARICCRTISLRVYMLFQSGLVAVASRDREIWHVPCPGSRLRRRALRRCSPPTALPVPPSERPGPNNNAPLRAPLLDPEQGDASFRPPFGYLARRARRLNIYTYAWAGSFARELKYIFPPNDLAQITAHRMAPGAPLLGLGPVGTGFFPSKHNLVAIYRIRAG
jgi:hypothetical protein